MNSSELSSTIAKDDKIKTLIRLEQVGVTLNNINIIDDINIIIEPNVIITLVGPNGGGKTTLAKIITGLIKPSRGNIYRKNNLRIGYVPQKIKQPLSIPIYSERFVCLGNNCTKYEGRKYLELVELQDKARTQIEHLSGGEMQRLLVARALAVKPELLVLDEPDQGVDTEKRALMYNLIKKARDLCQCSVILISHNLHLVMRDSDQVFCINKKIMCTGSPKDLTKSERELLQPNMGKSEDVFKTIGQYLHNH